MKPYTYKSLQDLCSELKGKIEAKQADQKEVQLAVVAAHALDFLNLARDNHLKLDLSLKTEKDIIPTILKLHLLNSTRGMTAEDSRMIILKKLGGYELFTIYNGIAELSPKIQFEPGPDGLLLSYENPDRTIIRFDVYGELDKVLKTFRLSSKDEEFYVFGSLSPFYDTLTVQFLQKIQ